MIILILIVIVIILILNRYKINIKETYSNPALMSQYIELPNDNNPYWIYEKNMYYPAFYNPNYRFPYIL